MFENFYQLVLDILFSESLVPPCISPEQPIDSAQDPSGATS